MDGPTSALAGHQPPSPPSVTRVPAAVTATITPGSLRSTRRSLTRLAMPEWFERVQQPERPPEPARLNRPPKAQFSRIDTSQTPAGPQSIESSED